MDKISAFLIEKETITGHEFMEILRKCQKEAEEAKASLETAAPAEENATETANTATE